MFFFNPFVLDICPNPAKEIMQGIPNTNDAIVVKKFVFKVRECTSTGINILNIKISLNKLKKNIIKFLFPDLETLQGICNDIFESSEVFLSIGDGY